MRTPFLRRFVSWLPACCLVLLAYTYFIDGWVYYAAMVLISAYLVTPLAFRGWQKRTPLFNIAQMGGGLTLALVTIMLHQTVVPDEIPARDFRANIIGSGESAANAWPILRVVDGDTIVVRQGERNVSVRLIGIDAPEEQPTRTGSAECYGKEASAFAEELMAGKKVRLEADATQDDKDRYSRVLRHVFLEDGTNIQKRMLKEGYALLYVYDVPSKYHSLYSQAAVEAKNGNAGIWKACGGVRRPLK